MMKSFFKKLAFVMALAMVVSMAAPAATTASAASDLKIAYQNGGGYGITELNIAEVGATEDLKFLGAPSNWKELGATWSSNNEAVATVDQAGVVTAVAPGTAEVAVQIGAEIAVVKVNVVNVATYTATMGTADDRNITAKTIEEGDTFDFAFYGIKDYDVKRYFCTWASDDTSVATVDQKGLVTAVKAGTAKITLIVFNKVTGQVHNVDACTVTVPGEATPTPVVNSNEFTVAQDGIYAFALNFNEEKKAEDIKNNLKVSLKLGSSDLEMTVDSVTVDGKTAVVTLYSAFENGEVYTITYADYSADCTVVVGDIAKVEVSYYAGKDKKNKNAYVAEEEENDYVTLVPTLYDADGRDVTSKYDLDDFDFDYEITGVEAHNLYKDTFVFYSAGNAKVDVTATWIDNEGELQTALGQSVIPVKKRGAVALTFQKAGFINASDPSFVNDNFGAAKVSFIAAFKESASSAMWNYATDTYTYAEGDTNEYIFNAVFKDDRGNTALTGKSYTYGDFSLKSSNENVLTIDDNGRILFHGAGKANVLVYFTAADGTNVEKFVGSKTITVLPSVYPVTYKFAATTGTAASHVVTAGGSYSTAYFTENEKLNDVKYQLFFYDQNGNQYWGAWDLADYINVDALYDDGVGVALTASWNGGDGCYDIWTDASAFVGNYFDAANDLVGTYRYKVTLDDVDKTETIKTPSATFALTIKNTKKEANELRDFFNDSTDLPSNYFKYTVNPGWGKWGVDVAVNDVVAYKRAWNQPQLTRVGWTNGLNTTITYQSTGNLPIAYVPGDRIVEKNNATTGEAGTVYYKVTAPSKAYNGTAKKNWNLVENAWDLEFKFNDWATNPTAGYAVNGDYTLTFFTTKKTDTSLFRADSAIYPVSNSQPQIVYKGVYDEYGTKTTENVPSVTGSVNANSTAATRTFAETVIEQNLKFMFEEYKLGEYAGTSDKWNMFTIDWNNENTVVSINADRSIRISKLAIVCPLDNGNADLTDYTYTSVVNVGVTIYQD